MNWTGGRLQRHSGKGSKGGALTSRQKEHFAKAQANLRSGGPRKNPTQWSIFDKISIEAPVTQSHQGSDDSIQARRNTRVSSGKTRTETKHKHSSGGRRHDERQDSSETRYPSIDNRSPSLEVTQVKRVPDDDLYDATPPPLKIKRERAASIELSRIEESARQKVPREPEEESMDAKRRRLLSKEDWAGLHVRRPAPMRFNPMRHDEEIGRRRKLTDGHRARYSKQETATRSPFRTKKAHTMDMFRKQGLGTTASVKADVRISIGDRVVPPGLSSSSRPTKVYRSTPRTMPSFGSQFLLSDEMLLDNESFIDSEDDISSDRFLAMFEATVSEKEKPRQLVEKTRSRVDPKAYRSNARPETSQSTNFTGDRNSAHDELESIASSFSRCAMRSVCDTGMKQPVPRRTHKHPVLHLSSPQCNSSILAQIGQSTSVVPKDQTLDNKAWKTWIEPLTHSSMYQNQDQDRRKNWLESQTQGPFLRDQDQQEDWMAAAREPSISPGMSAAPTLHRSDNQGLTSLNSSHDDPEEADEGLYDDRKSYNEECAEVMDNGDILTDQYVQENSSDGSSSTSIPWDPPQGSSSPRSVQKTMPISKTPAKIPENNENHEEIWMKFVFGGSNEDENDLPEKDLSGNRHPQEGSVSSSSMHANAPTEYLDGFLGYRDTSKVNSPSFSTFVRNSLDSESPLEPRYVASGRRNFIQRDNEHRTTSNYGTEVSPGLSTYVQQSIASTTSPSMQAVHRKVFRRAESRVDRHIRSRKLFEAEQPTLRNRSNSGQDSLSMVTVATSHGEDELSMPAQSNALGSKRKVFFTKPRPFIGLKANMRHPSPERAIQGTRRPDSDALSQATSDDIEDG